MKKTLLFMALALSFGTVSCTLEEPVNLENEKEFRISVEEALSDLNDFESVFLTKSSQRKEVKSIDVVYGRPGGAAENDTLLYVVNYADEGGYAVISADMRIRESILMISESGNIDPNIFRISLTKSSSDDISADEYADSIAYYKNLYQEDIIGGTEQTAQEFIASEIISHAEDYIARYGEIWWTDDNPSIDGSATTWSEPINIQNRVEYEVLPMLKTRWHQRSPFNSLVPKSKPAGCVPIAIAQIMTYNRYPENLTVNGYYIDWDALGSKPYISEGTSEANMVMHLIRHIQIACNSWLFSEGTFTFPKKAEMFLRDMGYINVKRMLRYDEDRLFEYLQKGYPVFLSGAENISLRKSHGWVVDGWYKSFKVYDMKDKATGKITGPHTKLMGDYLHCNWGNASDSWVVAGVFNDTHSTYNTLYRMITYEVPGR